MRSTTGAALRQARHEVPVGCNSFLAEVLDAVSPSAGLLCVRTFPCIVPTGDNARVYLSGNFSSALDMTARLRGNHRVYSSALIYCTTCSKLPRRFTARMSGMMHLILSRFVLHLQCSQLLYPRWLAKECQVFVRSHCRKLAHLEGCDTRGGKLIALLTACSTTTAVVSRPTDAEFPLAVC